MRSAKCKDCPEQADRIVVITGTYKKRERYCKACFIRRFKKQGC